MGAKTDFRKQVASCKPYQTFQSFASELLRKRMRRFSERYLIHN
jgi:hypothetical protein